VDESYRNAELARARAMERKAAQEAAQIESARLQQEKQQRDWQTSLNVEEMLRNQQAQEAERSRNLAAGQAKDRQVWSEVGAATELGTAEQQRRDAIRQENAARYQRSLQERWGTLGDGNGQTAQQTVEARRRAREQQALEHNLGQWSGVMTSTDTGLRQQQADRVSSQETQRIKEQARLQEWQERTDRLDSGLSEQTAREQARRANEQRYQEQLKQEWRAAKSPATGTGSTGTLPARPSPSAGGTPADPLN
jgi:hypothetical protein